MNLKENRFTAANEGLEVRNKPGRWRKCSTINYKSHDKAKKET
jgi:hypothetical protein